MQLRGGFRLLLETSPEEDTCDLRIAFLGVYQVRDFEVQREIGLVVLGIASIVCQ